MKNAKLLFSKFPLISTALAASLLAGCGKSNNFEVAQQNLAQPESTIPEEKFPPAPDSAERINQGNDPGTREKDPIFQRQEPVQPEVPSKQEEARAETRNEPRDVLPSTPPDEAAGETPVVATPPQPAVEEVPAKTSPAYVLPRNTFETVRVRLFPVLKGRSGDAYVATRDRKTLRISNSDGMVVKEITGPYDFEKSGKVFDFNFDKNIVTVDGKEISFSEKSVLGIFPNNADEPTHVKLDMHQTRLKNAGVDVNSDGAAAYRGIFSVRHMGLTNDGKTRGWGLVNYVKIDDYLRSVVPSEIGFDFHTEAIKAQSMAARTFALRHMTASRCAVKSTQCQIRDWDVDPTTLFQAYLGVGTEREEVNRSIDQTRGQYMKFNGAPIVAMFHSSSGGKTKSIQDFQCSKRSRRHQQCVNDAVKNYPYLTELDDPMNGPRKRYGHGVGMPQYSAQAMAKAGSSAAEIVKFYYPGSTIDRFND